MHTFILEILFQVDVDFTDKKNMFCWPEMVVESHSSLNVMEKFRIMCCIFEIQNLDSFLNHLIRCGLTITQPFTEFSREENNYRQTWMPMFFYLVQYVCNKER